MAGEDNRETTILNSDITTAEIAKGEETLRESGETMFIGDEGGGIIEKDAFLLDTYRILSDAMLGGMGQVWRVRHTGWNIDLAVKQPKAELFRNEKQKAAFTHECEAWINLGLHPHIVSCYYVREIGGVPSIFSEWMDGGSLKDWIEDGRLYDGESPLERVLDIAIQFERGLAYAHEHGLIHQDVKPDNLLLTKDGEAKMADFGIAGARSVLGVESASASTGVTMISASGAYTPAYCSPEQLKGETLFRRTDVYSWAVSVLEMFLGGRIWQSGAAVGSAADDYLAMEMRVDMPDSMKTLLKRCLETGAEDRPRDFTEIDEELLKIYKNSIKKPYPREISNAAADTADSLNNRALSFLDLGKPEKALKCWEQAKKIEPTNPDVIFNSVLYEWRNGCMAYREDKWIAYNHRWDDNDSDARNSRTQIKYMLENNQGDPYAEWLCANFLLEFCDFTEAEKFLRKFTENPNYPDAKRLFQYAHTKAKYQREIKEFIGFQISFDENGELLYTANKEGMEILSADTFEKIGGYAWKDFELRLEEYDRLLFSPNTQYCLALRNVSYYDIYFYLLETKTGKVINTWTTSSHWEHIFSEDSERLLHFINEQGKPFSLDELDIKSGVHSFIPLQYAFLNEKPPNVLNQCFSRDGHLIALQLEEDKRTAVIIVNTQTGKIIKELFIPKSSAYINSYNNMDFSYDQKFLVLQGRQYDRSCLYWNLTTDEYYESGNRNDVLIRKLCFWVDEKRAFVGSELFDINTKKRISSFDFVAESPWINENQSDRKEFNETPVNSACVHPSGEYILFSLSYQDKNHLYSMALPDRKMQNCAAWSLSRVRGVKERAIAEDKYLHLKSEAKAFMAKGDIEAALHAAAQIAELPGYTNSMERIELNAEIGRYCRRKGLRLVIYKELEPKYSKRIKSGIETISQAENDIKLSDLIRFSRYGNYLCVNGAVYHFPTGGMLTPPKSAELPPLVCFSNDEKYLYVRNKLFTIKDKRIAQRSFKKTASVGGIKNIHTIGVDIGAQIADAITGKTLDIPLLPEAGTVHRQLRNLAANKKSAKKRYLTNLLNLRFSESPSGRYLLVQDSKHADVFDKKNSFKNVFSTDFIDNKRKHDDASPEGGYNYCDYDSDGNFIMQGYKPERFELPSIQDYFDAPKVSWGLSDTHLITFHSEEFHEWDLESGDELYTLRWLMEFKPYQIHVLPDRTRALADTYHGLVMLDLRNEEILHSYNARSLFVTPNGSWAFLTVAEDKFFWLNLDFGKISATLPLSCTDIVFHPNYSIALADTKSNGYNIIYFDWEYEFPGWTDWDDAALPYLKDFIARHGDSWTDDDFAILIKDLQYRDLGYIRPEGVRKKLKNIVIKR
jgi:serine/threonine protein kinase